MAQWYLGVAVPDGDQPLVGGLLLQELIERGLWIFRNDEALCGTSLFSGLAPRFGAFAHRAILRTVPRPGIGPGRPDWSPACKAGLSTSSSTGAQPESGHRLLRSPTYGGSLPKAIVQRVFESALIADRNGLPDVQLLRIRADFLRVPVESREHTRQRHVVLDADRLEELGVSTSVLRGEQRFDQFALFTLNQLQELTDPLIRPTRARRWRVCTI